jgi:hypothetical protein
VIATLSVLAMTFVMTTTSTAQGAAAAVRR